MDFFKNIISYRLVLFQLVSQNLTLKYRRTGLGFIWTLVNPLLTMTVTTVVFSMMMKIPVQSFAIFLFAGLIPWTLFSSCLNQGGGSILENEALIKKIYIPKQVFVTSKAISLLIDALLSFVALFIIALFVGVNISAALLFLPIAFILVFVFSYGVALAMSVINVYFRDIPHISAIILQAGYYLTPILYPITMVPEKYQWFFYLNPMFYFIELFRAPIYNGTFPGDLYILICIAISTVSLLFGLLIFKKYDKTLIFRL